MIKRRKIALMGIVIIITSLLSACSLLPVEEEFQTVPVFVNYEAEEFTYVLVEQGDLETRKLISAECEPTVEEELYFNIDGISYDTVYFNEGDTVNAGDLLAELDMGNITQTIEDYELQIAKNQLRKEYIDGLIQIDAKRRQIEGETAATALLQATDDYLEETNEVVDSLYVLTLKLEEEQEKKAKRQIYASIDGMVTYIYEFEEGETSKRTKAFMKVIDSTFSFVAETKDWMYLPVGDEVSMKINSVEYIGTVTGLADGEDGYMKVSVELPPGSENFAKGTRATITVVTDQRLNVLYLPKMVVTTAGEDTIVYVEQDGVRKMQKIVTGFESDSQIEIVSGLEKGDLVIKE